MCIVNYCILCGDNVWWFCARQCMEATCEVLPCQFCIGLYTIEVVKATKNRNHFLQELYRSLMFEAYTKPHIWQRIYDQRYIDCKSLY